MNAPEPPVTVASQIAHLHTTLAWLEEHAHTIPDDGLLFSPDRELPVLVWWDHSKDGPVTVDGPATVARLTEGLGAPERDDLGWHWRGPVRCTVYGGAS